MSLANARSWAYQIQGLTQSGAVDALAQSSADLVVVDPSDTVVGQQGFNIAGAVAELHATTGGAGAAKQVFAYLDVGEAENFRTYWQNDPGIASSGLTVAPDPDGWGGDFLVKFWDPRWVSIAEQQIAHAVASGFDGAYLDWLAVYSQPGVIQAAAAEGKNTSQEIVSFVKTLVNYAHSLNPNFQFIAQNAPELGQNPDYMKLFDAIAQEDLIYSGSPTNPDAGTVQGDVALSATDRAGTMADLALWKAQGKPVFDVEYALQTPHVAVSYAYGAANGYVTYVTGQLLDHLSALPTQSDAAPLSVADTASNIQATLDVLQTLAAAGKLAVITPTDSATLTVTPTQLAADPAALRLLAAGVALAEDASAPDVTISGVAGHANTVVFTGAASEYTIAAPGDGTSVVVTDVGTGRTSTDHLSNVSALQFSDHTDIVASQTPPAANAVSSAQVTELYSAVFGRTPDVAGLAFYQNYAASSPSTPFTQFAQWFLASPEYAGNAAHNYAQTSAGDAQFITDSYGNLLHRAPASGDAAWYQTNVINPMLAGLTPGTAAYSSAEAQAHAQVLAYFSQSPEFLADVTVTAQNPTNAQHWLVLV